MVGRYHIDPESAVMRIEDWPEEDRTLWQKSLVRDDPFSEDGARAELREISNKKVANGYGRYLTFLQQHDPLAMQGPTEHRITAERVKAFIENMIALGNGKQTILTRLQELHSAAVVLAPKKSFRFMKEFESRVRGRMPDDEKEDGRFVTTDELLSLGISLMEQAHQNTTDRLRAIDYRDGLIIALLALRPMRRKNFAALKLDYNIVKQGNTWRIILRPDETKTYNRIDVEWPSDLVDALETYLTVHRPHLISLNGRWAKEIDDALWVSSHGSPMTQVAFYQQVTKRTEAAFGKTINPHRFRHIAASTLAVEDPVHVRVSASILGHSSFRTTEDYYIQAQRAQAHEKFVDQILIARAKARQIKAVKINPKRTRRAKS